MNEIDIWFPEGQEAWGNSSTTARKVSKKKSKKQIKKYNKEYKIWLEKFKKDKKDLEFSFLIKSFKTGDL